MRIENEANAAQEDTITITSLDADGCALGEIFNQEDGALLDIQSPFWAYLLKVEKGEHILMCGSNRQSITMDFNNAYDKKSRLYFPLIEPIATALGIGYDSTVLGDMTFEIGEYSPDEKKLPTSVELEKKFVCNNSSILTFKVCTQLQKAIASYSTTEERVKNAININVQIKSFDANKLTIVLFQMHRAALKKPGKKITYRLIDDTADIFANLIPFLEANKELIPSNVTFEGHHFSYELYGKENPIAQIASIKGTGSVNEQYVKMVRELMKSIDEGKTYQESYDELKRNMNLSGTTMLPRGPGLFERSEKTNSESVETPAVSP